MPDLVLLRDNEEALAAALLPDEPDPADALEPREQFLTHAYLVLACAIVEEFIEDCFDKYVDKALQVSGAMIAPCFVSLATKYANDVIGQTNTVPPAATACPMLRGLYRSKVISPNNGVKRNNILALAKPLGISEKIEIDCDPLLGPADALGSRRGQLAHLFAITEELRPADARKLVTAVLDEMHLLVTALDLP